MKIDNKGKVGLVSAGIMLLLLTFVSTSFCRKEQGLENKKYSYSFEEERTIRPNNITGKGPKNDLLKITRNDTMNEPFEQEISLPPIRIRQKIIYESDKKGEEGGDLNRKVDSSIYFATLVIVILAFILQGLRIWLSQLEQDWFATMDSGIIKYNPVAKDKLIKWFEEVEKRRKIINIIFGILYLMLLISLITVPITLITCSQPYDWFKWLVSVILFFFVAGIGTVVFGFFIGWKINPVRINCTNYGGIAESLRKLQKEAIIKQCKINNKDEEDRKMDKGKSSIFAPARLGAIGALGVLLLLINLGTGTLIVLVTGVMAAGAFLMTFLGPMMYVVSRLIIGRFGAGTLVGLVYSVIALGFPIMGPPGFIPKLFTGIGYGLITDAVFALCQRREKIASVTAGILDNLLGMGILLVTFKLFLPPAMSEKTFKMMLGKLPMFIAVLIILGGVGGFVGWLIYSGIRNRAVIRRLQGE